MNFGEELALNIAMRIVIVLIISAVAFVFRWLFGRKKTPPADDDTTVQQPSPIPLNQDPPPVPGDESTLMEPPTGHRDWISSVPDLPPQPQPQPQPQPNGMPDYRHGTVALQRETWEIPEEPRCMIVALSGPLKGRVFPIPRNGLTVGRSGSCDISFPPDTRGVSGNHCRLTLDPQGRVLLTDSRSTYGTYLGDGRRLPPYESIPLHNGQTFLLAGLDGPAFLLETR